MARNCRVSILFTAINTGTQRKQSLAVKCSLVIEQGTLEVSKPLSVIMISDKEQNSNKMCHKWDTCEMVEVTYRLKHSRHSRKKEILLWKKSENSLILKSKSGSRGSQYQTEL